MTGLVFHHFLGAYSVVGCHTDNINTVGKVADVVSATSGAFQHQTSTGIEHLNVADAVALDVQGAAGGGGVDVDSVVFDIVDANGFYNLDAVDDECVAVAGVVVVAEGDAEVTCDGRGDGGGALLEVGDGGGKCFVE